MSVISEYSFHGGINTDIAPELLPKGDYLYALNIDNASTGEGEVGMVTNIKGNVLVDIEMPDGNNICIGTCKDGPNKRLFYFVYNSNGLHGIYRYDYVSNSIHLLLQSELLNFDPNHLILHADMAGGNMMYWVDGLNPPRKTNVDRLLSGEYTADFEVALINAHKDAPTMPAIVRYATDVTKNTNFCYGSLFKFIYRFIYDDGEISGWSDFSKVPTPENEGIRSGDQVISDNNCMDITMETGNRLVSLIEVGMQRNGLDFVSIAILNKKKLAIPNNTYYIHRFFNDGSTSGLDPEKIIKAHNYMPDKPKTQKFVYNALVYGNFEEGFEDVAVDIESDITQVDFDYDFDIVIEHNNPDITWESITQYYEGGGLFGGGNRHHVIKVTIYEDVKKGNRFIFKGTNYRYMHINFDYTTTEFDDAFSVATRLLNAIGFYSKNITTIPPTADGAGNVSFQVDISAQADDYFAVTQYSATSTEMVSSLAGESKALKAIKNGSSVGYAIVYENPSQKKSSAYTDDNWLIRTPFITESGGLKITTHKLTINHKPPLWATRFHIVRTKDLIYNNYIQLLIQRAVIVEETNNSDYYDLSVGSLVTYNKIHENSVLAYEFKKGDRLRLIKENNGNYYPFYETEVLSFKETTEVIINKNITTDKTENVTLTEPAEDSNIGKFIVIGSERREIIGTNGNDYILESNVTTEETFSSYTLHDLRGVVRIKKPDTIAISDLSLVEIYNPAYQQQEAVRPYFEFGEKYEIINPGTSLRAHAGNVQHQTLSGPCVIHINTGDSYIKAREIPTSSRTPGAQTKVEFVEDRNFSDFYESDMTDLGRAYLVDTHPGVKDFPSRLRYSNNFIEGTRINGLNDFDNTDRVDINDAYGAVKLLKYSDKRLYVFKELKTGWFDLFASRITDQDGTALVGLSDKLLNNITYFGWQGGIGDHPESFAMNGFRMYYVSANSGTVIRLSTDGESPISEIFATDEITKERLAYASKNRTRIYGGFELLRKQYVLRYEAKPGDDGTTTAFKESNKRWVSNYSYAPEFMEDFETEFLTFKNGRLYIHNKNSNHNNFYGVQYKSRIDIVANEKWEAHKLFEGMKIDATDQWTVPDMHTDKNKTYPNGTRSRLTANNFKLENGEYWADILMDMDDPRFTNKIEALYEGREIQGKYLVLQLENESISENKLKNLYIYTELVPRNI